MKVSELLGILRKVQEQYGDIDVVAHKYGNFMGGIEKVVLTDVFWMSSPRGNNDSSRLDNGFIDVSSLGGLNDSMKDKPKTVLYLGPKVVDASTDRK